MPILKNPRYERFSQELAKGIPAEHAYVTAGFRPSRQGASTLRNKIDISERVTELLALREKMHGQSTAKAIEKAALTKEWVISNLMENAMMCMGKKPTYIDPETKAETFDLNPQGANKALELLGKEIGMFIERHEHGGVGAFSQMSDEELDAALAQKARELGLPEETMGRLIELRAERVGERDPEK